MLVLGIETSCDDTGIALLECESDSSAIRYRILADIISSQVKIHAPFGGVVPTLAARAHTKNILPCLKKALGQAKRSLKEIDLIAVTIGPGLIPSLLTGVNAAKALGLALAKPLAPINHLEGHIFANFFCSGGGVLPINQDFPAICLLVSGGHTQLLLVEKLGYYRLLGETRDDAAGEAFDKVAKLLGLSYPGGPVVAKRAEKGEATAIFFPRPMLAAKNYDFSFSGLKTAVLYETRKNKTKLKERKYIDNLCASFQQAVIEVLISKTLKAAEEFEAKIIMLGGGVAANEELRNQLAARIKEEFSGVKFLTPELKFCTDNAAMIALTGYFHRGKSGSWRMVQADANLCL